METDPHPRRYSSDIPASGAWMPGDAVGNRQFCHLDENRWFALEGGGRLRGATIAYETWGELDATASNAILVCHALTGDSHAAGPMVSGHASAGWWNDVIGPGKALDTDRYFVVCSNVLGGCQGSTGPASIDPDTGTHYGPNFPTVTVRDMVRAQAKLSDALGVQTWVSVVGGSMGGMQVLEWACMFPERVRSIAAIASTMEASPQQIAWSAAGRTALVLDPKFRGGDYYDAEPGDGPHAGLAVARSIAQITYRSDDVFASRFGRDLVDNHAVFGLWDRFQIESYLDHHGQKLARRFDANSYLLLNRAMDLHDISRRRVCCGDALGRFTGPALTLSITSDTLYPPRLQAEIAEVITGLGGRCDYVVVDSPQGHDGFLLEFDAISHSLDQLLQLAEKGE